MPITDEQSAEIKEQLLKQLSNFPEDKQKQIKKQVNSMTTEEVENFVQQNQLTHMGGQCIFCSITTGQTPSYKIAENENNIAVLEINPLSKGHSLIIPKDHISEITQSAENLAQKISKKLKEKFNPQEIQIKKLKIMEHNLLEVIPIYGDETERKQATEDELKNTQEEILKEKEIEIEPEKEIPKLAPEELFKLPPRIPR